MPLPSSTDPSPASSKSTAWGTLAFLAGSFLLSCGVVVGVVLIEFALYSKGNSGFLKESLLLLAGSLLVGVLTVLRLLLARRFHDAIAVLLGLLPVLLLAWFIHGVSGWGPIAGRAARPAEPLPSEELPPEPAALFPGTDSARVYSYVEQLPELPTGGGLIALVDTLTNRTARRLGAQLTKQEGIVVVSFVVGPRGGLFLAQIEESLSPVADSAVLAEVRRLPRLQPGRQNGRAVAVRLRPSVVLPPPVQ
ncbi:energy transducer TonB [Solirubrum puertoriconensis]|uniref:TonB C-terminal domain-containing protein n=1 Tax=Solirubrum puertoriconensis TaxID=1751427 RepID=A0A9X0HN98_SOLP1|nr:energy transducer TonB [Solirubrum puertoriconensis]KUG09027.1 hypothetical protein ASU33_19580 [Solirubrum puertoriconensis]